MLELLVKGCEYYDEKTNTFIKIDDEILILEHSLSSLTKWEAKFKKSLIEELDKGISLEGLKYYIECMTVNIPNNKDIYLCINQNNIQEIQEYLNDPMSATTFTDFTNKKNQKKVKKEIITSEIIYYWMLESGIPFECDKWNLNHLIALIRVVSVKNSKNNTMSKKDSRDVNRALMAQRRAAHK